MENVKYERTKFYFSLNRLSFIIQSSETYEIIELLFLKYQRSFSTSTLIKYDNCLILRARHHSVLLSELCE